MNKKYVNLPTLSFNYLNHNSFYKSIFILILSTIIIFLNIQRTQAVQPPSITASTAAVIDTKTGQALYDKHMHLHRPPASLTKILTAIVAIEKGDLNDIVTVSRKAAYQEGSSIYLEKGEKITLEDLLYGIMLASGNDAAVAIAEHLSGSVENFARLMNIKAKQMGAKNSNFLNPHGLPQAGHYSTAYDLAMIMKKALENEIFARITATKEKTISWNNNTWGRGLRNHNKLLWSYPGITGGKTGYTRAAGPCLIASASKGKRKVIAVVLNSASKNIKYRETRELLDYGINNFKEKIIINKRDVIHKLKWETSRDGKLCLIAEKPLPVIIPKGEKIKIKKEIILKKELMLPIKKGEIIGKLFLYQQEKIIGKTNLLAGNNLNFNSIFLRFWYWISSYISNF